MQGAAGNAHARSPQHLSTQHARINRMCDELCGGSGLTLVLAVVLHVWCQETKGAEAVFRVSHLEDPDDTWELIYHQHTSEVIVTISM